MADVEPTPPQDPTPRFTFAQLRQMLQNANIKTTKGAIESSNYVAGVSGWRLGGDGSYEFN